MYGRAEDCLPRHGKIYLIVSIPEKITKQDKVVSQGNKVESKELIASRAKAGT